MLSAIHNDLYCWQGRGVLRHEVNSKLNTKPFSPNQLTVLLYIIHIVNAWCNMLCYLQLALFLYIPFSPWIAFGLLEWLLLLLPLSLPWMSSSKANESAAEPMQKPDKPKMLEKSFYMSVVASQFLTWREWMWWSERVRAHPLVLCFAS